MDENSYLGRYFEGLFLVLIFLVSIQTFCEEYFIFMNYSVLIRKYMIIAGCAFDLIFTIEFFCHHAVNVTPGSIGIQN